MSLICTTRITTTAAAGSKTCSIQPPTSHLCMWCLFGEYTLCTTSADCTLFVTGGSLKRLCVCASVCVCVRVCMYVMDIYPKNLQVQVHRCTQKVVCVCAMDIYPKDLEVQVHRCTRKVVCVCVCVCVCACM